LDVSIAPPGKLAAYKIQRPLDPSSSPSANIALRTGEMAAAAANFL
jgi:hypothetical protein